MSSNFPPITPLACSGITLTSTGSPPVNCREAWQDYSSFAGSWIPFQKFAKRPSSSWCYKTLKSIDLASPPSRMRWNG